MTIRAVYSTNDGMNRPTGGYYRNEHNCAVAIGTDGETFSVNIVGPYDGYVLVSRDELKLIRDAIDAELRATEQ